jgi:hypothetical protein
MKSTLISVAAFVAGAAAGTVVTWKVLDTKYKRLAQEEIESVKESFRNAAQQEPEETEYPDEMIVDGDQMTIDMENVEQMDIREYAAKILGEGYTNYTRISSPDEDAEEDPVTPEEVMRAMSKPYVISPDEFDTIDDYGSETLTYYADGVLTDDMDNVIEDVDAMIGRDSLNHFGEYEDDSVYVRNDKHQIDYEILKDQRKYTDVFKFNPLEEDE